jgi:uncharacterized protein (TIGR02186 family)
MMAHLLAALIVTAAVIGQVSLARAQTQPTSPATATATATAPAEPRPENVEADVSTRSVAVTSSFTGTEIVVFGAIDNARHLESNEEQYEIVITLEGARQRLVARRKSNVTGIWVNTESVTFADVPSYYAIASTRPLDEIADPIVLRQRDIGFEQIPMQPERGWATGLSTSDLRKFKSAVIRLKRKERLYVESEFGVRFVGRNLFRATIDLPANVPVGPLATRVYLFRNGQLIDTFESRVQLAREGIERYLYDFAFSYPMLYGIAAVIVAIGAGLAASSIFQRHRR